MQSNASDKNPVNNAHFEEMYSFITQHQVSSGVWAVKNITLPNLVKIVRQRRPTKLLRIACWTRTGTFDRLIMHIVFPVLRLHGISNLRCHTIHAIESENSDLGYEVCSISMIFYKTCLIHFSISSIFVKYRIHFLDVGAIHSDIPRSLYVCFKNRCGIFQVLNSSIRQDTIHLRLNMQLFTIHMSHFYYIIGWQQTTNTR